MLSEKQAAKLWDNPRGLIEVEEGRYTTERALAKLIRDAFRAHVPAGAFVVEGGAGLGYLKSLVPQEYQQNYVTTDYSARNLSEGLGRRQLSAIAASVYELPLADNAVDCLVDLDAYDTLPNLDRALIEAKRVLKPNGIFMHFQVNYPSDDTVEADYPGYIFFPAKSDKQAVRGMRMGVTPENLREGLKYIALPPLQEVILDFLKDPMGAFVRILQHPEPDRTTALVYHILDAMPVDKLVIPSLPDYFRNKLGVSASRAGLQVVESEFRATSLRLDRSKSQLGHPHSNQFSLEQGTALYNTSAELQLSGSNQVIEKVSMLIFVARNSQ